MEIKRNIATLARILRLYVLIIAFLFPPLLLLFAMFRKVNGR